MESVTHHGRETAYRDATDGPDPVLYIHGSGGTHSVWGEQCGRPGHDAVALDLSGHGDSEDVDFGPRAGLDAMAAYADDLVAVARETDATVLCGNSLGGAVALTVALDRELPLDGLVLVGTGAKLGVADDLLDALGGDYEAAIDALVDDDMLYPTPTHARRPLARRLLRAVCRPAAAPGRRRGAPGEGRPARAAVGKRPLAVGHGEAAARLLEGGPVLTVRPLDRAAPAAVRFGVVIVDPGPSRLVFCLPLRSEVLAREWMRSGQM